LVGLRCLRGGCRDRILQELTMWYRIQYKKFSEVQKGFLLVEETYEAADVQIIDGNAVIYGVDGFVLKAVPVTCWGDIERVEPPSERTTPTLVVP
jgi:hypothetical protein